MLRFSQLAVRRLSTSRALLNEASKQPENLKSEQEKPQTPDVSLKAKLNAEPSTEPKVEPAVKPVNRSSKNLYLHPEKWTGLPPDEILSLFKQRKATLGARYAPRESELEALLSTSEHTGVSRKDIKTLYDQGELAHYKLEGIPFGQDKDSLPAFEYDEFPAPAQKLINIHRQQREYNRIAAYEMPLLAKYRQVYESPKNKPITYRYTTFIGEPDHPGNKRVTMTVLSKDLGLNEVQLHKFQVLAGTRYNATSDEFKMSCSRFQEPLQNTRYLSDTLKKLITEAKVEEDTFSDVPLDQRHVKARESKRKFRRRKLKDLKFPEEWKRPEDAPAEKTPVAEYLYIERVKAVKSLDK